MVRRMGFRRWQKLHKLVYVTGVAGVVHYWWSVKSDIRSPLMYALILTVLLGWRIAAKIKARAKIALPKAPSLA